MGRLFGTDGVRGLANRKLSAELSFKLGLAASEVLLQGKKGRVLIGRDTRISGDLLLAALSSGLMSGGVDVVNAGILPTPAVAYLTEREKFDAGIMISASHNPVEDNGIKFFAHDGFKLNNQIEDQMESALDGFNDLEKRPIGLDVGRFFSRKDLREHYLKHLQASVGEVDLKGVKIVLDCANGAASGLAKPIFEALQAEVIVLHNSPNGANINAQCGSTYPRDLQDNVLAQGADYGFAFDGDADRCLAVDEKGNLLDGDEMMAFLALNLKRDGLLHEDTLVATVMSNIGLHRAMAQEEIKVEVSDVGDRYVLAKMQEGGYTFGGEQSGHFIFSHYATTGDGLLTALLMSRYLRKTSCKMSQAAALMQRYPQVLHNERVPDKTTIMNNETFIKAIAQEEKLLEGEGRVLVRPSGTEPLIRIMVESKEKEQADAIALRLAQVVKTII
ncbi:MAG: phosphoglucosamine mutase [Firmicutes bacterium]|nr:phosphoglucosamine mutase [Bacillota bacterium]